jgi:hypothetical protein
LVVVLIVVVVPLADAVHVGLFAHCTTTAELGPADAYCKNFNAWLIPAGSFDEPANRCPLPQLSVVVAANAYSRFQCIPLSLIGSVPVTAATQT